MTVNLLYVSHLTGIRRSHSQSFIPGLNGVRFCRSLNCFDSTLSIGCVCVVFWIVFNYLLTFVCGVFIVGGAFFGWLALIAVLKGWVLFDDGKRSNFD